MPIPASAHERHCATMLPQTMQRQLLLLPGAYRAHFSPDRSARTRASGTCRRMAKRPYQTCCRRRSDAKARIGPISRF